MPADSRSLHLGRAIVPQLQAKAALKLDKQGFNESLQIDRKTCSLVVLALLNFVSRGEADPYILDEVQQRVAQESGSRPKERTAAIVVVQLHEFAYEYGKEQQCRTKRTPQCREDTDFQQVDATTQPKDISFEKGSRLSVS